ncbi:ATP-binding protein [Streptomyces spectabilis]|uniref:ATP-binding protein n=1 Tax=Streptomyces spectabilis TaxID=68270 RepID=A0A516REZ3_STRST|nr:ATP-binding protein [Streptomyces spectabilis]QDQ14229.1 ATP-binding protein [Streptomyces spectabilis]
MNGGTSPTPLHERFYRRERQSIPAARAFTRAALAAWAVQIRAEDIALCVSELTTNALVHGAPPGRGFKLRLLRDSGTVRIEVHDSGDGRPRLVGEGVADESGRGLLLVAALADKWGVAERNPGKVVWAEFGQVSGAAPPPRGRPGPR